MSDTNSIQLKLRYPRGTKWLAEAAENCCRLRHPRALVSLLTICAMAVLMPCRATAQDEETKPNIAANQEVDSTTRYWTTDWSFEDVDVAKLVSRLGSIGIKLPVEVDGVVTLDLNVSIPLNRLSEAIAYRIEGELTSERLRIEQLDLRDFQSKFQLRDGVVALKDAKGSWPPVNKSTAAVSQGAVPQRPVSQRPVSVGSFTGNASVKVIPRGEIRFGLELVDLPIGPLDSLVRSLANTHQVPVQASVTGSLEGSVPADETSNPLAWRIKADLRAGNLQIDELPALAFDSGLVRLERGVLFAPEIRIRSVDSSELSLNGSMEAELVNDRRFRFRVTGNDIPLHAFAELTGSPESAIEGKIDLNTNGLGKLGKGDIVDGEWSMSGEIASPGLRVFGQNLGMIEHDFHFDQSHLSLHPIEDQKLGSDSRVKIQSVDAKYFVRPKSIELSDLNAAIFSGALSGNASLIRGDGAETAGRHQLNLKWTGIQPSLQSTIPGLASTNIALETSGVIEVSVDASVPTSISGYQGGMNITVQDIALGDIGIGEFAMNVQFEQDAININGKGQLFGGKFSVATQTPVQSSDRLSNDLLQRTRGQVQFQQLGLQQASRLVDPQPKRRLSAKLSGTVDFDTPDNLMVGAKLVGLSVNGKMIARRLDLKGKVTPDAIVLDRISGQYAGGQVSVSGRWALRQGTSQVQVSMSRVDASEAVLPLSEQASSAISGLVSGRLTVSNGAGLQVRGSVSAHDSALFGIRLGTIRSGLLGAFSVDLKRWRLRMPSISGSLAGGSLSGEASLSSSGSLSNAFDLKSRWTMGRVNFGQLLAQSGASTSFADGQINGSLRLDGKRVRNVKDLSGSFAADLRNADGAAIPGLTQANHFLGAISLATTQFDSGEVSGIIGGGTASIQEFWVRGDRVRVFAQGRVGLVDQRMDLEAVISTGDFRTDNAELLALATQLAIQSVLPISALAEINEILSDRTLHFDVLGTFSSPRLRLDPFRTLEEEASRFLLREALMAATTGEGIND